MGVNEGILTILGTARGLTKRGKLERSIEALKPDAEQYPNPSQSRSVNQSVMSSYLDWNLQQRIFLTILDPSFLETKSGLICFSLCRELSGRQIVTPFLRIIFWNIKTD